MVVQCCVCHRVREGKEWTRNAQSDSMVSHSYCPECLTETKRQIIAASAGLRPVAGAHLPA